MSTTQSDPQNHDHSAGLPNESAEQPLVLSKNRILRSLLVACLFWTLCLTLTAAGHRLYKSVVFADLQISQERYQSDGPAAVWVGHGTIEAAYSRVANKQLDVANEHISVLPNSRFWLAAACAFTALACLMAWSGRYVNHNGTQSLIGLFAGHFLWLGSVEFGLDAVGRRLGLSGALDMVNGRFVGTHGSGILIQMSVVFLVPVLLGLTMHESNRCVLFQWFRKRLPLTQSVAATGRIENYAARTTIQYFLTVWFCYVAVLWMADPRWGQFGGVMLMSAMVAIFIATPYMIWRTTLQSSLGQALRYSVSGAVVTWTGIEIAAAMKYFDEPWLSHSVFSGILFGGLTLLLTALVFLVISTNSAGVKNSPPVMSVVIMIATLGLAGCGGSAEDEIATSPDEIAVSLREFNDRTIAPDVSANDGLLRALASDSPELAAQAAVAFGKSDNVSPAVMQTLQALAVSDDTPLSQMAALQALSRLDLLTPETQSIIDELATNAVWAEMAAYIAE